MFLKSFKLVLSCEHAGTKIPTEYRKLFSPYQGLLSTHRGCDVGALELAESMAQHFSIPLFSSEFTRLLVDLNRSPDHPSLFSEITRSLNTVEKARIMELCYFPYRNRIKKWIGTILQKGRSVIHISIHSFTPVFNNRIRKTDIGLLFDPERHFEKEFCTWWRDCLRQFRPRSVIHFNLPYRGTSDGLTSEFRKQWQEDVYCGIELEINQKYYLKNNNVARNRFDTAISRTLEQTLLESDAL